jgi:hypothetical protein
MYKGWIKWYRQSFANPMYQEKPFDTWHAWEDLCLLANSRDEKMPFNGIQITVKKGQHLTSYLKLSARWGWSTHKIRNKFAKWTDQKMMELKTVGQGTRKATLITIRNYRTYQESGNTKDTQTGQITAHKQEYIYNNIAGAGDDKNKKGLSDWQVDVSCVNRRLRLIDKMEKGDPGLVGMLIKRHGFLLTIAKIEQIGDNAGTFTSEKHAKAYIIASLKKASVGNIPEKTYRNFHNEDGGDYRKMLPDIDELLKNRG